MLRRQVPMILVLLIVLPSPQAAQDLSLNYTLRVTTGDLSRVEISLVRGMFRMFLIWQYWPVRSAAGIGAPGQCARHSVVSCSREKRSNCSFVFHTSESRKNREIEKALTDFTRVIEHLPGTSGSGCCRCNSFGSSTPVLFHLGS